MNVKQITLLLIPVSFVSIAIFSIGYVIGSNDNPAKRQDILFQKVSDKFTETAEACSSINALADYNGLSSTLSLYEGVKNGELSGSYKELETMLKGILKNELKKTSTYFPKITDPDLKKKVQKTISRAEKIVSNSS